MVGHVSAPAGRTGNKMKILTKIVEKLHIKVRGPLYCWSCEAWLGDGHDCDNCHFCNTAGGEY